MTESAIKQPGRAEGERFETAISVRAVAWFLAGWAAVMVGLLAGVWAVQRALSREGPLTTSVEPALKELPQPLQPSPGHPQLPWQDMAGLRAAQEGRLNSRGADHVPIKEAMEKLLRSGALTRPWQNPATQPYRRPRSEEKPSVENRT
ncbi:MAG TPA: hypothetical protein VHM90_01280 [Phycisphaerae bacterium]|nr:hypothetical protein [Phycisphaerae bacterium]